MAIASFIAGEAISAGDAVFTTNTGKIYRGSSVYLDQAAIVGIALESGLAGYPVRVDCDQIYVGYSGLTPGEASYVSLFGSGQLVNYAVWVSGLAETSLSQAFLSRVGSAVTSSGLSIEREVPIFINNPSETILLESSSGIFSSNLTLENGFKINLESAP